MGPCLRVGAVIAEDSSSFYDIPIIPINHALGHIELGMMLTKCQDPLVLLVSGGHTMILAFLNKKWRVFWRNARYNNWSIIGSIWKIYGPCLSLWNHN